MAQPAGNPKIEELRARVKADPKSRLFYPLAEELRKVGQLKEAEDVLVSGLAGNPTYLSAWVSLGRVLKDLGKTQGAIEALNKALSFDRENIVAARLLAHIYLENGDKVEAIKKFKLVHALLPADLEIEAQINQLERELNPPKFEPLTVSEQEAEPPVVEMSERAATEESVAREASEGTGPPASGEGNVQPQPQALAPSPFMPADEEHLWQEDVERAEPVSRPTPVPARVEQQPAPSAAIVAEEASSPFEESARPIVAGDDLAATVTMGDLYAQQGYFDSAREIYEKILAAHPGAEDVRAKLAALPASGTADRLARREVVVRKLQQWLTKVSRREAIGRI